VTDQPAFADLDLRVKKSKTRRVESPDRINSPVSLATSAGTHPAPLLPWAAGSAARLTLSGDFPQEMDNLTALIMECGGQRGDRLNP